MNLTDVKERDGPGEPNEPITSMTEFTLFADTEDEIRIGVTTWISMKR